MLSNNNKLGLIGFDETTLVETNWIYLGSFNGTRLSCRRSETDNEGANVGINIISLMRTSKENLKIVNIQDVVNNFDIIYEYIKSFPETSKNAKVINMDNKVERSRDHWCNSYRERPV